MTLSLVFGFNIQPPQGSSAVKTTGGAIPRDPIENGLTEGVSIVEIATLIGCICATARVDL